MGRNGRSQRAMASWEFSIKERLGKTVAVDHAVYPRNQVDRLELETFFFVIIGLLASWLD